MSRYVKKERTILFRGKVNYPSESGWLESSRIKCSHVYACDGSIHPTAELFSLLKNNWRDVDPNTLGQFIGRTDKHGTRIFEDDIFTVNGRYPKIIKYDEEQCAFMMANIHDLQNSGWMDVWQMPSTGWWSDSNRDIEVVGNIHDNPEMLEDGFDFDAIKDDLKSK